MYLDIPKVSSVTTLWHYDTDTMTLRKIWNFFLKVAEYSNFVRNNQILPQKVDFWGKQVAFYSNWRSNQEWPSNSADTVYELVS